MKSRTLIVCTIVGAIVLFAYQSLSHALIPSEEPSPSTTGSAAVAPVRRNPVLGSGFRFNAYGVFMGVAMKADTVDRSAMIGPMLTQQLGLNLIVVFFLCLLIGRMSSRKPVAVATASALAGLPAAAALSFPDGTLYGFTLRYALVNTVDMWLGFFATGLAIGAVWRWLERTAPASSLADAAVSPPHSGAPVA